MRFEDVLPRLERLPTQLSPMPRELLPVLLPDVDGAARVPDWPAQSEREAAVLLLIHPDETGDARIVLTERTTGGHRHAGQISLPGGAIDPYDESVEAAALREAREEISLDAPAEHVRVAGVLPPVEVRVSGFRVRPVVATVDHWPALQAEPREVAAILHAPLAAFLPAAPIRLVSDERDGLRLRYGAYPVDGRLVWGATAGILARFAAFLAGVSRPD